VNLPKLGETKRIGDTEYVATTRQRLGDEVLTIWTPIPAGMAAADLGRRFRAALVQVDDIPMYGAEIEHTLIPKLDNP